MLEDKCRLAINRYHMLNAGDSVVVGLSGGADSCALLHYLCVLRRDYMLHITAVHVNHMIRGEEADRDAAFSERLCKDLGVEFHLYRRDVPAIAAEKGIGLEECGREIRYEIFGGEAEASGAKIATAHTLSDSVETVLFHVIRGCSISGLKGIPPVRGNIIRPLILCERQETESYCKEHGMEYITDSSNFSADYTRNKIRLQLLPLMREINPSVSQAVGRLSETARTDDAYLCELADRAVRYWRKDGDLAALLSCESPVLNRALIVICSQQLHITPEQKHVVAMAECLRRGEGSVNLPGDNIFVCKCGKLDFVRKRTGSSIADGISGELPDKRRIAGGWSENLAEGKIITPFGDEIICLIIDKNIYNSLIFGELSQKNDKNVSENCLDYDKIKKAAFRFRREGDAFRRAGRNGSKTLKKLFNESKIPPDVRMTIPLLESDGMIAWISGIGVAEGFTVTEETKRVLYIKMC